MWLVAAPGARILHARNATITASATVANAIVASCATVTVVALAAAAAPAASLLCYC
jgi:hypothetical protein